MNNRKIPHRQLTAWLAAALMPTTIQLLGGASWLSVLLAVGVSMLLIWFRWRFGASPKGKLLSILQWLLLVAILITACRCASESWPGGAHPVVGFVLLALALWSVRKGSEAAARVGSVLFWFVLGLYLVLFGAGVKEIRLGHLKPTAGEPDSFGCVLLLTPAAAALHLYNKEGLKPRLLLIGVFAVAASVLTAGVLSPALAMQEENAFYEMTRSLNLLGQARRFEAVLSAGMTVAWYSLLTLYLSLCEYHGETAHSGWGKWGSIAAAVVSAIAVLCDLHIPAILLLLLATIFWVMIPLLTQGLEHQKKS